ncbi:hypothetical protein O1611_g9641 [Lasiodiplodia mahajangana]|uniref:Uncharacterized protein n=1 Tax=Lasiodiplodia mahajangana TaxID=1108764 RepID=A0ACC2J706_9PEZI|nr:hypothetical protein O1611_g9641 [Lasiodiplodia mahajangana]
MGDVLKATSAEPEMAARSRVDDSVEHLRPTSTELQIDPVLERQVVGKDLGLSDDQYQVSKAADDAGDLELGSNA